MPLSNELIYDWNRVDGPELKLNRRPMLNDETLRDGLQSPSVLDPPIEKKIQILHLMEDLGIDSLNLGLPGAGPRAKADVLRLAREIISAKLRITANCAARTIESDIIPIADVVQATGLEIEAATFLGSSPIRQYAEDWTLDFLLRTTERAVKFARSLGLPAMYVTEDTTRARPEVIKKLYTTAIECGARAIVVCDTVGHVTPRGVQALLGFVREEVVAPSGENVRVDWHGHSDRGLAVANSLAAFAAGADSVHAAALGIGERVGNTPMDQMLVNLKLMAAPGWADRDLRKLKEYCSEVSEAVGVPIPPNYPVVGSDAFRTATGVHAAAVIKAYRKNDVELANQVYSGVPSHWFGMDQKIEIGPMSGKSNVIFWLERRGIEPADELVEKIFARAKQADRLLTEAELLELCGVSVMNK
ncbi:MAG: 2-isopropylmalate synthase [Acidobacteria bacterium]|nr:MAG: 2-isopropylmalate synthase [Acidobacteriota bacterium]